MFTDLPWGGRSRSKLLNLAVKQANRVEPMPYKGCVPLQVLCEDHLTTKTLGFGEEFTGSLENRAPARGSARKEGRFLPITGSVIGCPPPRLL